MSIFLVGLFVYFHTACVRTAKTLVRLRGFAGPPEPSLVAYVISTIISWAGSSYLVLVLDQQGSLLNLKDLVSTDESTNSTLVEDYCGLPSSVQPTVVHDSHLKPVGIQQQQRPGVQTVLGQQTRIPTSKPPITSQTVKSTLPTPLNTVNVPRPTPLVQSNVNIPISANVGKDVNQSVPPKSHDQSHDPISMIPSSDRAFLASQIAELNKQHGEAQKRLESLMVQQKNKAPQSQDMKTGESQLTTQQQPEPGYSQPLQSHMNQSQKGNQEQNMELQHLQQLQQRQQQLQRQQQQKLLVNTRKFFFFFILKHTCAVIVCNRNCNLDVFDTLLKPMRFSQVAVFSFH